MFTFFQGTSAGIVPSDANACGYNDYGVGTGSQSNYPLTQNTYATLNNSAQSGDGAGPNGYIYSKTGGSLTGSGSVATLSPAPVNLEKVILPSINPAKMQAYDTSPYPLSNVCYFAAGDLDSIATTQYTNPSGFSTIQCAITNRINETDVAVPAMYSFAPVNLDFSIGSFGTPGAAYSLQHNLLGGSSLASAISSVGATSVTLVSVTNFYTGQFVKIDTGGSMEVAFVTSISGNTLNLLQPLMFTHLSGSTVFAFAEPLAVKLDLSSFIGISGGVPKNWFNLSLDASYDTLVRV